MLARDLLIFFLGGSTEGPVIRPESLDDFIDQHPKYPLLKVLNYAKKLEYNNLLYHAGLKGDSPYFAHSYYTSIGINMYLVNYGCYDHLVEGFLSIRNRFADTVLPVIGRNEFGDARIGSCFVLSSNTIITAMHCVKDVSNFQVLDKRGNIVPIEKVYFPSDSAIDIAILKTQDSFFKDFVTDIPKLNYEIDRHYEDLERTNELRDVVSLMADGEVLEDVLSLGYPPVAGFDSMLIASKSQINSTYLRSSSGEVVAIEPKYFHNLKYLVINSKVKGGNSGGPIFNSLGLVVGVIVEMPLDMQDKEKFDQLGYGLAIPSVVIKNILDAIQNSTEAVQIQTIRRVDSAYTISK